MTQPADKGAQCVVGNTTTPDQTSPDTTITKEQAQAIIKDRGKKLHKAIEGICPALEPRARAKCVEIIGHTLDGLTWRKVAEKTKVPWSSFASMLSKYPNMQALYKLAREINEEVRHLYAVSEMERRAVDGWEETVWNLKTGEVLGVQRKFSDRLLEIVVKAGDPQKYSDKHQLDIHRDAPAVVITYIVEGVTLGQQPPPKTYDLPPTNVTEALPENGEDAKPQ